MKLGVFASALAASICLFTGSVNGHPFRIKRAFVTETVYVTHTVADAIVYVDDDGTPYLTEFASRSTGMETAVAEFTSTSGIAAPTSSPSLSPEPQISPPVATPAQPAPPEQPVSAEQATSPETSLSTELPSPVIAATPEPEPPQPLSPEVSPPAPPPPSDPEPEPSTASSPGPITQDVSDGRLPLGVTYDPFTGAEGETRCKTEDEINEEFEKMRDYKAVRIYGMGCHIIPLAIQNAVKNSQKVMAGIYLSHKGNGEDMGQVISTFKAAVDQYAGGDWNIIPLFSVENERVNDQDMTASEVVDAINNARANLRSLGYNGPVGAVETVPAMIDNPSICEASDVVMVNCHAFFDRDTKAEDAGPFVKTEVQRVKEKCNNKRVVITESGWPHQGDPNGAAVPSAENQRKALESLQSTFDSDIFIHNAFDSTWKTDWAASFGAERYWGVL